MIVTFLPNVFLYFKVKTFNDATGNVAPLSLPFAKAVIAPSHVNGFRLTPFRIPGRQTHDTLSPTLKELFFILATNYFIIRHAMFRSVELEGSSVTTQ